MKKPLFVFTSALFLMGASILNGSAQQAALSPSAARIVHTLRDEARAAEHNATIYQWRRVNREVDRIVAQAHRLPASVPAPAMLVSVQKAVDDIRAARLHRNADGVAEASRRIVAECNTLLRP